MPVFSHDGIQVHDDQIMMQNHPFTGSDGTRTPMGCRTPEAPTPEDLIIMKTIAHRPKGLVDIRTIADKYPTLDKNRLKEQVEELLART